MASHEDITACLGQEAAVYAANKHRGGRNGNKGTRYEDYFIAYKVVEAAVNLFEDQDAHNPHIQGQVYGFVDDARIASANATDYYQLKNKDSVSWTSGDRPLATDFEYQYSLSIRLEEPEPSTALVVPEPTLAQNLKKSVPDSIKRYTAVYCFPWCETANRLVYESEELRERLAKLSHVENASNDTLYSVFCALLMACMEKPEGATVEELLNCASQINPIQLRLLPATEKWEQHLRDDVKKILAKIDGLVYGAKRGVFYWSCFGTSGIFESNVLSKEFKDFQDSIVQLNPKTFDEFESLLP